MPPESLRFVAYVGDAYGYCTGAIIAPTWVLTAAHCVVKGDGTTIRPDEINDMSRGWPDDDWERVPVKRVVSHPDYYWQGDGFRNDVALIELARPFASSDLVPVQVLGLEDEARYAADGAAATAVGYGDDENGRRDRDGLFRVVSAPLHHAESCRVEHSFVDRRGEIVHDGTLCFGDRARGIRSGDSGGPLLVETDEGYGLIGVASMSGNDPTGYPVVAVYARVATVKDWIDGCVLGTGECIEGGVKLAELQRHGPDEIRASETLGPSTAIIFVNETEQAFSYYWIDFNENERSYGSVAPGESYAQHTYPGHVWAVKDAEGRTFGVFVADTETGRALISDDVLIAVEDDPPQIVAAVEDVRVEGGDAFAGWVQLEKNSAGRPVFDYAVGDHDDSGSVVDDDPDHGTPDLNEETTPGTWGAAGAATIGKPFLYGAAWAVYRTDDGSVVQVAVHGGAADPSYAGAAWRTLGSSGWGGWNYGAGPDGIDLGTRAPRHAKHPTEADGPVTIAQVSELNMPFPPRDEYPGHFGVSEREWGSVWVLLIRDEATGSHTGIECYYGCRAWGRTVDGELPAVAYEDEQPSESTALADTDLSPPPVESGVGVLAISEGLVETLHDAMRATKLNESGEAVPDWAIRLQAAELMIRLVEFRGG